MPIYTGTIPDVLPGDVPDGADWQEITDALKALTGSWSTYTLAITASTTAPTQGNSVYSGSYKRVGKDIHVRIRVTIGNSGFAAGSGDWRFSLPVNASATAVTDQLGIARVLDAGVQYRVGTVAIHTSFNDRIEIIFDSGSGILGSAGPGSAWAAGDQLRLDFVYEGA